MEAILAQLIGGLAAGEAGGKLVKDADAGETVFRTSKVPFIITIRQLDEPAFSVGFLMVPAGRLATPHLLSSSSSRRQHSMRCFSSGPRACQAQRLDSASCIGVDQGATGSPFSLRGSRRLPGHDLVTIVATDAHSAVALARVLIRLGAVLTGDRNLRRSITTASVQIQQRPIESAPRCCTTHEHAARWPRLCRQGKQPMLEAAYRVICRSNSNVLPFFTVL
jgi:hypothetical protein